MKMENKTQENVEREEKYNNLKRAERIYNFLYRAGTAAAFSGVILGDVAILGCVSDFVGHPIFQESTLIKMIWGYTVPLVFFGGLLSYGGYVDRENCRTKLSQLERGRE